MAKKPDLILRLAAIARHNNQKFKYVSNSQMLIYNQPKGDLLISCPLVLGGDDIRYLKVQTFPLTDFVLYLHGNTSLEWYKKLVKRRLLNPKYFL